MKYTIIKYEHMSSFLQNIISHSKCYDCANFNNNQEKMKDAHLDLVRSDLISIYIIQIVM